jgi:hypothetical protein
MVGLKLQWRTRKLEKPKKKCESVMRFRCITLRSAWVLSQYRRDKDTGNKGNKTKKKNEDTIVFGNELQDKIIIFVRGLFIVDKT